MTPDDRKELLALRFSSANFLGADYIMLDVSREERALIVAALRASVPLVSAGMRAALEMALAVLPAAKIASNPFNVSEITAHNETVAEAIVAVHAALASKEQ